VALRENAVRILIAALACLVPTLAFAEGTVCGPTCTLSWPAVTTYTDGTLIPADKPVTYGVYIATTNVKPATPVATVSGTSYQFTAALGQHYTWLTARAGSVEGLPTAAIPFARTLGVPATPSGVSVK
jgi:hypothetical protein